VNEQQRDDAVFRAIAAYTAKNTVSKEAARKALIDEGIYTKAGKIRAAFSNGKSK